MGLLARKINVFMTGERQLLDENKERSGDTRAIRQNRTHRKSEADKQVTPALPQIGGANAVKAEGDSNPIGQMNSTRVIVPTRREELSAQRRKKKLVIWGVDSITPTDAPVDSEEKIWYAAMGIVTRVLTSLVPPYTSEPTGVAGWFYHTYLYYLQLAYPASTPRINKFSIINKRWRPSFSKEQKDSRKFYLSHTAQVANVVSEFDWTFRQRSPGAVAGSYYLNEEKIWNGLYHLTSRTIPTDSPGIATTIAEIPYLGADWFTGKVRYIPTFVPTLVASDGRYIYVSIAVAWSTPQFSFFDFTARGYPNQDIPLASGYQESNFVASIFQAVDQSGTPLPPTAFPRSTGVEGDTFNRNEHVVRRKLSDWLGGRRTFEQGPWNPISDPVVEAKIFRWKYDTEDPDTAPAFSMTDISYQGDGTKAGEQNFQSMFLSSLEDGNPHKQRWVELKNYRLLQMASTPNYTDTEIDLANDYLYLGSGSSIIQPGFVYYPTGEALYLGKLKKGGMFPNAPKVYRRNLPINMTTYAAAYNYLPRPSSHPDSFFAHFLTTHEDMLGANWTDVTDEYTWSGVSTYQDIFYAHRKKV